MDKNARSQWKAEEQERASTLKIAKAAAVAAIAAGVDVPDWATARVKTSFEEEDWWSDSILEGFWIGENCIPPPVEGIDTLYFDCRLSKKREEALLKGALPTEEERIVHRNLFLNDLFTNAQNYENELTFWHIFEVRDPGKNAYLLVASTSLGQGGNSIDVFEFFLNPDAALDWLRIDGVIDNDFCRWRSVKPQD